MGELTRDAQTQPHKQWTIHVAPAIVFFSVLHHGLFCVLYVGFDGFSMPASHPTKKKNLTSNTEFATLNTELLDVTFLVRVRFRRFL